MDNYEDCLVGNQQWTYKTLLRPIWTYGWNQSLVLRKIIHLSENADPFNLKSLATLSKYTPNHVFQANLFPKIPQYTLFAVNIIHSCFLSFHNNLINTYQSYRLHSSVPINTLHLPDRREFQYWLASFNTSHWFHRITSPRNSCIIAYYRWLTIAKFTNLKKVCFFFNWCLKFTF